VSIKHKIHNHTIKTSNSTTQLFFKINQLSPRALTKKSPQNAPFLCRNAGGEVFAMCLFYSEQVSYPEGKGDEQNR
jgi:hypothetical protein